jgi:DNA-binding NarL/FixJ family response regulator
MASRAAPLHSLLAPAEFDLVGLARNGPEIERLCPYVQPDVVVIDRQVANENGTVLVQAIHNDWPWIQVLLVGDWPPSAKTEASHKEMRLGHLSGKPSRPDLAAALRNLYENRPLRFRRNGASPRLRAYPDHLLSDREKKVCGWIEAGLDADQIAERLLVNELTARFYIRNVNDKLERAYALNG